MKTETDNIKKINAVDAETFYHYSSRNGKRVVDQIIKIQDKKVKKVNKDIRDDKDDKDKKEITFRTILISMLSIAISILFHYNIKEAISNDAYITLFFNIWMLIGFVLSFIISVLLSTRLFSDLFSALFNYLFCGYKKGGDKKYIDKDKKVIKKDKKWGPSLHYEKAPVRSSVKPEQTGAPTGNDLRDHLRDHLGRSKWNWPDYLVKQEELYNETYKDFIIDPKTTIKGNQ